FVSEFFAYYEDSEFSRWIIENGYKILYAPRSRLYHQHSATSSERSPLWNLLVNRSRNIYKYNGDYNELYNTNNHFEEYFKPDVPEVVYQELKSFSYNLKNRLQEDNDIVEKLKPIAIYNSYWNTKGGGESHALSFAKVLQKYETVYLISEEDFSIEELEKYYGIDLSNCRKLIETHMTSRFTKKFDIFINSTYQSNLVSKAKKSYYIVYFPQKNINEEVLKSYTFLYMNNYTKDWGFKYWGEEHQWDIVYPLGMLHTPDSEEIALNKKDKIILSVGRFFVGGHSKRQDVIAKAYKELCIENNFEMEGWKLVLIGSLDYSYTEHVKYVEKIKHILENTNYEIIVNSPRDVLNEYFRQAAIYIHASGFGTDAELEPEKIEHFGITPIEGMQHGCYPIVYDKGGPRETLEEVGIGSFFHTKEDLKNKILEQVQVDSDTDNQTSKKIIDSIENFITKNHPDNKVQELI
ncbi:MAG TPA: glycosyltransferase, partial [Arcobacter sp.]|nr:glycosyltransferase [Arcobacter sp.]